VKDGLLIGHNFIDLPDYIVRVHVFEVLLGEFGFVPQHMFIVADPYLVELLCVVGINGQEFNAFIKGQGFVHGLLQYPEIERKAADVTVGVFVFSHKAQMNIQM